MQNLLHARAGETLFLLGNEAIARGALEAGVGFVSGYPGTPASEIGDAFSSISGEAGLHFEWSVNEKVALEAAFGAAIVGARSLVHMKHLGLAYAGDPLGTIPYVGVDAGMVIVSAGDPGMVVSPNEQDQRHLARMNMLPVLEPCTPAEACAMTRDAFTLSEQCNLPVILRTTPAVAHTRGLVEAGLISEPAAKPVFRRRPAELTPIPGNARRMRVELDERLARAEAALEASPFFARVGGGRLGVLVAGAPTALVLDQVEELGLAQLLTVQTVGATHPVPRSVLESLLSAVESVLVVEELTPFLEDELRALAFELRPGVKVIGKRSGHLPTRFAYSPDVVADALAAFTATTRNRTQTETPELPPRPPILCPGCAHRSTYLAARTVFGDESVYFNDIGCYTLGYGPPLKAVDALLSMGSSISMAAAASRVLGTKTLAFIGDSTFFHSGVPALLNAAQAGDDVVVVVLDNRITAMTGHQPSPTTDAGHRAAAEPEDLARAVGVRDLHVVDPNDLKATVSALVEAKQHRGLSVVVAKRDCAIVRFRERPAVLERRRFVVDQQRCRHCGHETPDLHCNQGPIEEYERAMVLRRILDQDSAHTPVPTAVELEAPCAVACPANICVQGYVGRITGGRYAEALALIRRRNPLPVASSRVCHRPCEKVCPRQSVDSPVAINDLKRFLVDWEMAGHDQGALSPVAEPTAKHVAVIGAGPSGLACAHELALRGHHVVVFDEHDKPGGLLIQGIPAHRLPRDVLIYETQWILAHGVEFRGEARLGADFSVSSLRAGGFDAVYLGFGAMAGDGLAVPGDELAGRLDALDMLRRHHRGEDLAVRGQKVIVVGGGDAAVDVARTLLRLDASRVQIAYRRTREEMPAHPEEVHAAVEEGVELLTQVAPVRVLGAERVAGLAVKRTEPGAMNGSGRRQPVMIDHSEHRLEADIVIAAVGQRADLSCLDVDLDLSADGAVVVDATTGATSQPGIFAGGDLTPGPKTVVHAIADGRRAAYGIDLSLAKDGAAVVPVESVSGEGLRFFEPRNPVHEPGQRSQLREAEERRHDHHDVVVPLSEEQARSEAARCLLCGMCSSCSACTHLFGCPAFVEEDGRIRIDQALCNGCGVCVAFCPNGAIHEEVHR